MFLDGLILAAFLLGHGCLAVMAVNVAHGIGFKWKGTDGVTYGIAALSGVAMIAAAWSLAGTGWRTWPPPVRAYSVPCLAVALVGLPAATAAKLLRRRPENVAPGRGRVVDLAAGVGVDALVGEGLGGRMLRFPGNQSLRLAVERWAVELPGLPAALDGLTVLHLTDLHFARGFRRRYFDAVADEAARLEPDLVLFTGDLIDDAATVDWIAPVLSRVRGRLGQFAILGNHDIYYDLGAIRRELAAAGFADLDGRWATVESGGATLALGGTSAPWGPDLDRAARPAAEATLVLSHTPDRFPRLAGWGVDMVFAGHNHGGQFRLPVVGPVLMPSRFNRRFDMGFFRSGRSLMYVSRGVAGKHPLRYNCLPEITALALHAPRPASPASRHAERSHPAARGPSPVGA